LGAAVPGSKRTVITAELMDFKSGGDFSNLCTEDKLQLAGMRKEEGGRLFKSQRFELALAKYRKVVDELRDTNDTKNWPDEFKQEAKELKKAAELNKAACFLKLGDNLGTLSACNAVLKEDRNNLKAIFRRAKAHHGRAENVEAQRDLERVLELDPANADAKQLLPYVKKAQKKADAQGKNTFSKMCDAFGKMPERKEPKEEAARDPSPPKERSDVVSLTFRHELKLEEGETLCVYGSSEALGAWDQSKCVEMTLLPQKWEPPVGSGREPPKKYIWEVVVDVKEGEELVEYKYIVRGPGGNTLREEGQGHKCHVAGMGGTRQRLTDSWRK
jgi:tetratricopeptide (TPR) repeat protein